MVPTVDALLLGRMLQAGQTPLGGLAVVRGALAVSDEQLWLSQNQLVGGASVGAVPLEEVGPVTVAARRGLLGPSVHLSLRIAGKVVRFRARTEVAAAEEFARVVADELRRRA